tara:strand:+ start:1144 stop:1353 length:210 start_codon:yes stop_codon:yes gene_type:complete
MSKFPLQDSPEWEKIVDEAYENLSECAECGKDSIITLPPSIEVHSDGFTTLRAKETYCCDPECSKEDSL